MVLVTAANGFIGRRLVQVLSEQGTVVRRCTRTFGENTDLAIGEIGPGTDWSAAIAGVNTVVHLAGRAHVLKETENNPLVEYRRINTKGTLNLAQQAANAGIRSFVFISSIGVLGVQSVRPFTERDTPNPVGPYAISKLEAEQGLRGIVAETGMEVIIIRPPLVYGPNAPGLFDRLIRVANKGLPLPFGAIHNLRSFVALDNLVDLIVTCIEHPAAKNQTFLAGDGEDLSTTELLQRITEALGKPIRLIPIPVSLLTFVASLLGKKAMAQRLCGSLQVDISKARTLLGWVPPVSLDEGLRKAVEDFKK